jgi:hypothetical protein
MADKKRKKNSKKKGMKKEEVEEYFEVGNKEEGNERIIEKKGEIEQVEVKEGQVESQNKQLIIILSICGLVLLAFLIGFFYFYSQTNFEVNGVNYIKLNEGDVTFYYTNFSVKPSGKLTNYHLYIRNNPKELIKEVPFEGNLRLTELVALNMSENEELSCGGHRTIAIENLAQVLRDALGIKMIKDPKAECSEDGIYTVINIVSGDETIVREIGKSCYEIEVEGCEILDGTERFIVEIVETIVKSNNKK